MFAKTLVLTLVLAGTSLSFISNVSAGPVRGGWQPWQPTQYERPDPNYGNGG